MELNKIVLLTLSFTVLNINLLPLTAMEERPVEQPRQNKVPMLREKIIQNIVSKLQHYESLQELINILQDLNKLPNELKEEIANSKVYPGSLELFKSNKNSNLLLRKYTNVGVIENQNLLNYFLSHQQLVAAESLFSLIGQDLDATSSDSLGYTPLMYALMNGSFSLVEKILNVIEKQGYSLSEILNQKNNDTVSPLILASIYLKEAIPLLISKGADVNKKIRASFAYDKKLIPLMYFMREPFDPIAFQLLLAYKPDLYLQANKNNSHDSAGYALDQDSLEALALLINAGYDINHVNPATNETLLMQAAFLGKLDMVKFLISKKAAVNITVNNDETALFTVFNALELSDDENYPSLIETAHYLLDHGAKITMTQYNHFINLQRQEAQQTIEKIFKGRKNFIEEELSIETKKS